MPPNISQYAKIFLGMKNFFNNLAPNKIIFFLKILTALLILPFAFSLFYSGYQIKNSDKISVYTAKANLDEPEIYNYNFAISNSDNPPDNLNQTFSQEITAQTEEILQAVAQPTNASPTTAPTNNPTTPVPVTAIPPTLPPNPGNGTCPVTTQNCVPCNAGELYCRVEPGKSAGFKGWACQNNNPGNIRYSSYRISLIIGQGGSAPCGQKPLPDGYMVFTDYQTGHNALKAYINAINAGQHSAYPECGNCNLKYFFSKYAPAGDQNDPNSYANNVANAIGVNADTTTVAWVVVNKLEEFVNAIQTQEGWFVN